MSPVKAFLERLKRLDDNGQIEHLREIPRRRARYAEAEKPLPEPLQRFLADRRLRLYTHQARTLELVRAGQNVVLTTPTASGKTLAFNLPTFERLFYDKKATALYIYPMKALAYDQLRSLQALERATGIAARAAVYDGDTPQALRPRIRERSRLILTNPYALHQYLPWHAKWRRFFSNLQIVVLDEAHWYRGVFGSHVAQLLRRLRRLLAFYGADPQFILSSATLANPLEHAARLIGKPFVLINEDGSARGRQFFLFWNAKKHPGKSAHRQASELLAAHVGAGLQTLCFTGSRKLAELVARWARELLPAPIQAYRAGYLPEDRRAIERALKSRELQGVAATNALELGVDIGSLDAVIIAGYPGTVVSTWQQAGRAGRGLDDSLVTLVALENPLDQYFLRHPERLFERPHEHAIIDLENEQILLGHLMCATAELPAREADAPWFGPRMSEVLEALAARGLVRRTPAGWVYCGSARPTEVVSLESISPQSVRLVCDGQPLETLERRRALEEAHPGAVFLHQGETYLVERLDWEEGVAYLKREDVDYYTDTLTTTDVRLRRTHQERRAGPLELGLGAVQVTERVIGFRVRRYDRTLDLQPLDLPPVEFETVALYFTLPEELEEQVEGAGLDWVGGLHAAEHALIAMMPFFAMCDRRDIGGLSTPRHPDTGRSTIFLYDGFPGGIGIAAKAFQLFAGLVQTTYELVRDCPCEGAGGCPSCVMSPKCGNQNEPLDKAAARRILEWLRGASRQPFRTAA